MKNRTIVISLGGSIIVPAYRAGIRIQIRFLKKFKEFILKFLKKRYRFIIVAGGGNICREYQKATFKITKLTDEDKEL